MNILGKLIKLRAVEEEDLPKLHEWANDPEIWDTVGGWHFPYSMESQKKWFHALATDQNNQRLVVETLDGGEVIGTASFVDIDWKNNHAEPYNMVAAKEARGKGYGTDVIMAMMRYAFEELHFARLDGKMIEYNTAQMRVLCGKLGWTEEGRRKNWYFRKGRYWDQIIVGVTREDYAALISRENYWK